MGAVISKRKKKANAVNKTLAITAFADVDKNVSNKDQNVNKLQDKSSSVEEPALSPEPSSEEVKSEIIQNPKATKIIIHPPRQQQSKTSDTGNNNDTPTETISKEGTEHDSAAALVIQANFRGYRDRRELEKERQSAIVIQRSYRNNKINKEKLSENVKENDVTEIGKETKESFNTLQDEINETRWRGDQQVEKALMNGGGYEPRTLVLVSSNLPNFQIMTNGCQPNVNHVLYDFERSNIDDLLNIIKKFLNQEVEEAKLKSIAFAIQGGPGFFYLLKGKVFTTAKIHKVEELNYFLKNIGNFMSKLEPDTCTVDLIVNDICKTKSGETFLNTIQDVMHPNKVIIQGIGNVSIESLNTVSKYFNIDNYKEWKRSNKSFKKK